MAQFVLVNVVVAVLMKHLQVRYLLLSMFTSDIGCCSVLLFQLAELPGDTLLGKMAFENSVSLSECVLEIGHALKRKMQQNTNMWHVVAGLGFHDLKIPIIKMYPMFFIDPVT